MVVTSTFPRWENDTVPDFVAQYCLHMSEHFDIDVLAPHYKGSARHEIAYGARITRFRYAPPALEKLTYGKGIPENIKANPFTLLLVPIFFLAQILALYRLQNTNHYDLLHAHWVIPQGFICAIFKAFFPATIV